MHHARHEADKVVYEGIDHKSSDIFRLANQMRKENVDVVGNKPVKNDTGEMSMSEEAKQNAWAEHYERLLNVEFDWDPDHLSNEPPLEGPPIPITIDMVKKAISKMKSGKTAGPSGIVVEMIKAAGDTGATMIRDLATVIIRDGKVPTDWEESFIVCLYKSKGDALDRGNYRGLKLYANARSWVRVGEGFSKEFEVKVGVHQGSVLSPLLFIIVLEALSLEFRAGVPWEDLYADDLVIIADSLEECVRRLLIWKEAMEKKGLRVNARKTKVMICGTGLDLLQSSGEYPCAVCRTGVGNTSIYCNGCKLWMHKKCSGLQRLTPDPDYRCARCMGNARPIDGRPQSEVQVGPVKLEVVASFCYLGDMLSAGGGCEMAVTTRVKTTWKKFRELLPVLTSRHLSYKTRGHVYSSCVRSAMLHASETWHLPRRTCSSCKAMIGP